MVGHRKNERWAPERRSGGGDALAFRGGGGILRLPDRDHRERPSALGAVLPPDTAMDVLDHAPPVVMISEFSPPMRL